MTQLILSYDTDGSVLLLVWYTQDAERSRNGKIFATFGQPKTFVTRKTFVLCSISPTEMLSVVLGPSGEVSGKSGTLTCVSGRVA